MLKDNNQKSLKQTADQLMQVSGNVKGAVFYTHQTYLKQRYGEKGLKIVEQKLEELGYPLKFQGVNKFKMYPEGLSILVIVTAYHLFDWKETDVFDMGKSAPKYSFVVKLLTKHFISSKAGYQAAPKYWKEHYDFGVLEAPEFNQQEKYCVIRLKKYKLHPLACVYFSGYFLTFGQLVLKGKKISVKETKCIHQGDPYHEWIISWE